MDTKNGTTVSSTRVAVSPDTLTMLQGIRSGSGMSHETSIRGLILLMKKDDESFEEFGYRLRGLLMNIDIDVVNRKE